MTKLNVAEAILGLNKCLKLKHVSNMLPNDSILIEYSLYVPFLMFLWSNLLNNGSKVLPPVSVFAGRHWVTKLNVAEAILGLNQ